MRPVDQSTAVRPDPSGAAAASECERPNRGSSREGRENAHGPASRVVRMWIIAFFATMAFALAATAHADPNAGLPAADTYHDLTTPRRAARTFLDNAERRDYVDAARALDLRTIAEEQHPSEGPSLARRLYRIFEREVDIDLDEVSDRAEGDPRDGSTETIATLSASDGTDLPITMQRTPLRDGTEGWVFASSTVSAMDALEDATKPSVLARSLPKALTQPRIFGVAWWQILATFGFAAIAIMAAMLGARIAGSAIRRVGRRATRVDVPAMTERLGRPFKILIGLWVFGMLMPLLGLPRAMLENVSPLYSIAVIAAAGFLGIRVVDIVMEIIERRADMRSEVESRGLRTRLRVMRRVLHFVGAVVLSALALMQFDAVRSVGVSLLASAGVASIVLGLAAQRPIGSLFSGLQLSITQPLRLGDKVVIEKELGTVEEIALSYVVVKLSDNRTLVVPTSKLLEVPFENWSRYGGSMFGPIDVCADFRLDVPAFRAAAEAFVKSQPLFDGTKLTVQVTDNTEQAMTVQIMVSAKDPEALSELRCVVREWAFEYLRELDDGDYLPQRRVHEPRNKSGSGTFEVPAGPKRRTG